MSYRTIIFSKDENIGIIRLNRPERMNAVIEEMYLEIQDVLESCMEDGSLRAIVLTGSVLKKNNTEKQAFCAGADLKEHAEGKRTIDDKRNYILLAHETTRRIYEFPKPVIAAINGPARGAGVEMAMNCDFIYIAEEATLAFPEIGLGTFVGGGVTQHLQRIIGLSRAKDLIFSGRVIGGMETVEIGLALKCFPVSTLFEEAVKFAKSLAEKAPISMSMAKKYIHESAFISLENVLNNETDAILSCMETEDWQEGINAFGEKRKPLYKGK
ncbi:enoyl-CoA hydratase/isomerase family protein [Thermodesulfobacteriota bacterium]